MNTHEKYRQKTTGYVDYFDMVGYRLQKLTLGANMEIDMQTFIKVLFWNKKKNLKKRSNLVTASSMNSQFSKLGRLGQQLVVMSR
mgnify:CR=1 FL=1